MVTGYYNHQSANMSCCSIFDKTLLLDADISSASIDLEGIRRLIPDMVLATSGLWHPIVVTHSHMNSEPLKAKYCEPLIFGGTKIVSPFNPCNCDDSSIGFSSVETSNISSDSNLSCSYCFPNISSWNLKDSDGNSSPNIPVTDCCAGACDVRMKRDDYIPKIPVLNQTYLSGFLDFKYLAQFPACTNPGLGFERIITINTMSSINGNGLNLCVDWKLKDTIDEIPYNKLSSQHLSEYIHNKSYTKSQLVSKTCGNFIMTRVNPYFENEYVEKFSRLSGLIGAASDPSRNISLPSIESFEKTPYGLDQQTYNNIFIKNNKIASYWKWNYTSGILGWYRYYEINRENDSRPIPGIDLYIAPGDVFFATNDGPEPEPEESSDSYIATCPSGLKVVINNSLDCIIPSGSEFLYVSANLYPKFHNLYNTLLQIANNDNIKALSQAATLATAPPYDQVIVDLLKNNDQTNYDRNDLHQIVSMNKDMSVTTEYDSVSDLNYIGTKTELVNTLANKYGCYLWIPPNSDIDINFNIPTQSDSFYIDLDFDMVCSSEDISFRRSSCNALSSCGSKNYIKSFYYDQKLSLGSISLSTKCFEELRHKENCTIQDNIATVTKTDFANYSTLYLNDSRIKSVKSSNTCTVFEDVYPRIVDPNNITRYCTDCDKSSSFYLVGNAELGMCKQSNFCYKTLAQRFNSETDPPGTRKERSLADGSFRMRRRYNTLAFNPHVDLVAFHKDNGIFFNSKSFNVDNLTVFDRLNTSLSAGNPKITFKTKDTGIKIYSLYAEKLQSSSASTASCKRFPVEQNPCKCYGLNISDFNDYPYSCAGNNYRYADIFLPGLSTRNSPRLSKYGGYNQEELNRLFGIGVLTAGGTLATLGNKIIPEEPYGCERSVSIGLQNYVNTAWRINLKNFTTDHSDVMLKVSEYGDITANFARYVYNDYYFQARNNEAWKRFFTKVTFDNDSVVWKDQIKSVYPKGSPIPTKPITVHLQNSYLEKLTKEKGVVLAPPSGDLLSGTDYIFGQPVTYGDPELTSRGDETSTVTLTLTNKPRKQKLLFSIEPPKIAGVLRGGFFHPNSGLTLSESNIGLSPLKNNNIYYNQPLYEDTYDQGLVLIGDLNQHIKSIFNSLSELDIHKKPRLYLNISNFWYEAQIPNRGGFKHNNQTYVGPPTYFEYVHHLTHSKNIPGILPVPPKQHVYFHFIGNHPNKFDGTVNPPVPILYDKFTESSSKTILFPGSRYYFTIPEIDQSISLDFIDSIDNIGSLTIGQAASIKKGSIVRLGDGQTWFFKGNNPINKSDYTIINYDYLYHNFSDLHIKYNSTDPNGYVYNSRKKTNHRVVLYNDRGEHETNIVTKKELIVKFYDKSNKSFTNTSDSAKNFRVFTKLTLLNKVRPGYTILDTLGLFITDKSEDEPKLIKQYSFTIYIPTPSLQSETDHYLTGIAKSKWGDLLYYDNTVLDSLSMGFIDESYSYPVPSYRNSFYKIIVNNLKNKHRYKFIIDGLQIERSSDSSTLPPNHLLLDYDGLVYYNIHQKYNTNYDDKSYANPQNQYHNYLPFMDINLLSTSTDVPIRNSLSGLIRNSTKPISGLFTNTSLISELPNDHVWGDFIDPKDSDKFWIHLPQDTALKAMIIPNTTIYSPTLRIDDPPYWLYQTTKRTFTDTNLTADCVNRFEASNITTLSPINNPLVPSIYTLAPENRDNKAFYKYPIYCDTDNPVECGYQPCLVKNIGNISLFSQYKIANPITLPISTISGSVQYMLSYEGGNYNPLGSQSLITIKRFEIEPNSWLDSDNSCSATILKPLNHRNSLLDRRYQQGLTSVDDHSLLVQQTDNMANEVLFRIMHGEKTPINRQMLFKEHKQLKIQDLLSYSDPKTTAEDVYDQILYNYDRNVVPNGLVFNSTIIVNGKPKIGDTISMNIGSTNINLAVSRVTDENQETAIVLKGRIGNQPIDGKIYIEKYQEHSLIVTDGEEDAPEPISDDDSIVLVDTRVISQKNSYHSRSFPNEGRPLSTASGSMRGRPKTPVPRGPQCTIIEQITGKTWTPNYHLDGINNAGPIGGAPPEIKRTSATYPGCAILSPIMSTIPRLPPDRCSTPFDQCKNFQYGYCRRQKNKGCSSCPDTFEDNDGEDFSYSFDMCRNTIQLYGHTYREKHAPYNIEPTDPPILNPPPVILINDGGGASEEQLCIAGPGDSQSGYEYGLSLEDYKKYGGKNDIYPPAPGIAYNCWKNAFNAPANNNVYSGYVVVDYWGLCSPPPCFNPWTCKQWIPGGDWTEYCVMDKCKISDADIKNVYHRTTVKTLDPYNPLCPTDFITINYTNYSITITYPQVAINVDNGQVSQTGTKSICIPVNFDGACPYITINTLPREWILKENISSECSSCNQLPLKLEIPFQKQEYLTIKERRKCIIDTFMYGIINPRPLISFGTAKQWINQCYFKEELPCFAGADLIAQCGGGFQWFACLGSLSYTTQVSNRPLYEILCEFSVPSINEGPAALYSLNEWESSIIESYSNGGRGQENLHIPEADIVEGIVPGSVSAAPIFKTYTFKSYKARPSDRNLDEPPEVEPWYVNVRVAYYEYEYIRPKTIQDILKPVGVTCSNGITVSPERDIPELNFPEAPEVGGGWDFIGQVNKSGQYQCWSLPFPDSWWGWGNQGIWGGIGMGGIWGTYWLTFKHNLPNTFVATERYFRNDSCTNALNRYYKYNLEKNDPVFTDTNPWYAAPMPCASSDWYCWATLRWGLGKEFLKAKTGQTWV